MPPVLVLKTGEPRWYPLAVAGLSAAVVAALLITPLHWPYTLGVLLAAAAALARSALQSKGRARFRALYVHSDFSMTLVDDEGEEFPVTVGGNNWISRAMIVLPLSLACGTRKHIVIARDRNASAAFRRFLVICRFAFAVNERERHNGVQTNTTGA